MEEELKQHSEQLVRQVEDRTRELKESQAILIQAMKMASVLSLTDLYIIFLRHSRENGNLEAMVLDSCFRRNDNFSKVIYGTPH